MLLFKLAAKDMIERNEKTKSEDVIAKYSVKYQVLCKATQMVGVKKNEKKVAAEPMDIDLGVGVVAGKKKAAVSKPMAMPPGGV